MIRLENVSKAYRLGGGSGGRRIVLDDVSLTLPRGRSLALIGRNGAGKSTLLKMIAGTIEPDDGRILRRGSISWPLGFSGSFHRQLSGAQNARFVARIYGRDPDELIEYVQEFSELGDFLYMPVGAYSSGMKARLAFGISMGIAFDYYLVDEVTAVGDRNFRKKCRQVFRERLVDSDVIMVSHSPRTMRQYCEAGVVLENGRMRYFEDIEDAIAVHEENMGGEMIEMSEVD
ncbi:MAG: ABC transporter ATP-binding protein [Pseudomonadota bacterium]